VLGGSALGSPRLAAEAVGKRAAEELVEALEAGGAVDKYIQVMVVVVMVMVMVM
jgi:RNA 3'-terminal phosphate cyclase